MKITHRISFNTKSGLTKTLVQIGLQIKEGAILSTIEVQEDHEKWNEIERLAKEYEAVDLAATKFTAKELKEARWLNLKASSHSGYPMPDCDFGYLDLTYDLSKYNSKTGIGKIQKSSFRLKGEPNWKSNHILQLYWVYDVFFVKAEIWEDVFKPLGIACKPVLKFGTDEKLSTIVQLVPCAEVSCVLDLDDYPNEEGKYLPVNRGFFPSGKNTESWNSHFMLSEADFGSGASADKAVIVSNDFYLAVKSNKLKGVNFAPMAQL